MMIEKIKTKYKIPLNFEKTGPLENSPPGSVTYFSNPSYIKYIKKGGNLAILTTQKLYDKVKNIPGNNYIIVENPRHAFIEYHNKIHEDFTPFNTGNNSFVKGANCNIHQSVQFGKNVVIGNNVTIFPFVAIGNNVKIGDNTIIYSSVSIYNNVIIGNNCVIDSSAVLGGEGFSTDISLSEGAIRLKNIGNLKVGNNVEIGANTTIDRASFHSTIINDRVKIDNLVHISHNIEIGEDTRIASLCSFGGSTVIGKRCWISIGVKISHHINIGDDSNILINSVVVKNFPNKSTIGGFYAMPNNSWLNFIKDQHKKYVLKWLK
jgi:UDP-3-O-[3-hydroxymyristoyl] glucosamine N-acyltransferase